MVSNQDIELPLVGVGNVNLRMNYTGKILLGKDFIPEHYIHMGYQRANAYKKLIEVEFLEGQLIAVKDMSDMKKE